MVFNKSEKIDEFVFRGICLYFFLFLLYSLTGRIMPVNYFIGDKINQIMYLLFAGSGVGLAVLDFFTRRIQLKARYVKVLYCFIGVMVISSIVNIKYGYWENIKTINWTYIQIAVFYSFYIRAGKEQLEKILKYCFVMLSSIWSVAILISFLQFVAGDTYFYRYYQNGIVGVRNQGIFGGRLYGIFNDPNFASITSAYVIFMLIYIILKSKRKWWKSIICVVCAVLNYMYIFLSGSRTALVAFAGGMFVCAFFFVKNRSIYKKRTLVFSTVVSVVFVIVMLIGGETLKIGASKLPVIYQKYGVGNRDHLYKGEIFSSLLRGREDVKIYWNYSYETEIVNDIVPKDHTEEPIENKVEDNGNQEADTTNDSAEEKLKATEEVKEGKSSNLVKRNDVTLDNFTSNRTRIWKDYIKSMKGRYIIGTSPRNMMDYMEETGLSEYVVDRKYETHNGFLSLFVGCGLIGVSVILTFVVFVCKKILKYCFGKNVVANEFICVFSVLIVILIYTCAFTELFFVNNLTTTIFWMLLGGIWCWVEEEKILTEDK